MLNGLDCFILVYRLNVHGHNLAGFHIQKIFQQLVRQVGSRDLEIGHGTIHPAHLKNTVLRKGKTGRCNKVLYRQPALRQPLPIEIESVMVTHVEHIVHQMKPFLAVQQFCPDTQAFEVVHQVDLDVNEPRLCLFHGFRLNAKRQVLRLGQAVVALGKLAAQHGAVLRAHRIEMILLVRDAHHLLKIRGIRSHIHKRKLKADAGIKEVQEAAPFLKDSRLIFLLCQLVIDVLKLNGFGVVVVRHTADTIREHPLKGNAILS